MKKLLVGMAIAGAVLASTATHAAMISSLFNTGVDATGAVLADGTVGDPHYTLTSVPGGTTAIRVITSASGFPIPPYFGDNTSSRWIGPNNDADLNGPVGTYRYRTTFDLTGFDFNSASVSGGWSTDNNGLDILINGISLAATTSFTQFSAGFSAFSITSGFVAGVNTIDFLVNNGGGPTALRVEMTGTADVPEPHMLSLAAVALLGLGLARRRRAG